MKLASEPFADTAVDVASASLEAAAEVVDMAECFITKVRSPCALLIAEELFLESGNVSSNSMRARAVAIAAVHAADAAGDTRESVLAPPTALGMEDGVAECVVIANESLPPLHSSSMSSPSPFSSLEPRSAFESEGASSYETSRYETFDLFRELAGAADGAKEVAAAVSPTPIEGFSFVEAGGSSSSSSSEACAEREFDVKLSPRYC